jgi:hypothetical protein
LIFLKKKILFRKNIKNQGSKSAVWAAVGGGLTTFER